MLEAFAVVLSLAWLYRVIANRGPRQHALFASGLAVVLGITVSQPFGLNAQSVEAPPAGETVDPEGEYEVGAFRFHVSGDDIDEVGEQTQEERLTAESSVAGLLLRHKTDIANICRGVSDPPCWEGGSSGSGLRSMVREGDDYWLTLSYDPAVLQERGVDLPPSELTYTWELSLGIASVPGVLYWVVAPLLIALAFRRTRDSGVAENQGSAASRE